MSNQSLDSISETSQPVEPDRSNWLVGKGSGVVKRVPNYVESQSISKSFK